MSAAAVISLLHLPQDTAVMAWCRERGAHVFRVDRTAVRVQVQAPNCSWLLLRGDGTTVEEAYQSCRDQYDRFLAVTTDQAFKAAFLQTVRGAVSARR